jgi:hypothetical protein
MYVRRAWAESNLAEKARKWSDAEAPELRRAYQLRRDRLAAWRRERVKEPGEADPIGRWLNELDRPDDPNQEPPAAALMVVTMNRGEIKSIVRRPKATGRMLRQGWLSRFANVETMKLADLKESLEGRGFAPSANNDETVALGRLLPIPPETESQWLIRRAATEVANDSGLRFIQIQNLLLPEPSPGQPMTPAGALSLVAGLAPLLEGRPTDPLAEQLLHVAARGRVGAMVTKQETTPTLDAVRITISLYVRNGQRWSTTGAQTATVRTDALRDGEANDLNRDPQLAALFKVFESIGADFSPEVKQRSLNIGAATRKALSIARSAFSDRLAALALSLEPGAEAAKPNAPPLPP